jgi:hypothetical protein
VLVRAVDNTYSPVSKGETMTIAIELSDQLVTNGHHPGDAYHRVRVIITRRGSVYRVMVRETGGSDQGHLEEHSRIEVVARGDSIREACETARERAERAGIEDKGLEYLEQALSAAEDEAEEAEANTVTE